MTRLWKPQVKTSVSVTVRLTLQELKRLLQRAVTAHAVVALTEIPGREKG